MWKETQEGIPDERIHLVGTGSLDSPAPLWLDIPRSSSLTSVPARKVSNLPRVIVVRFRYFMQVLSTVRA